MQTVIACRSSDPAYVRYAEPMFALRYRVFHQRLQWDVKPVEGREVDCFDTPETVYLLSRDVRSDRVVGGWRLIPTERPYMLSDVFPVLLHGHAVPREQGVWEISRFAFDRGSQAASAGFGFAGATRDLLAETTRFALANGIHRFVLVVSTAVERLLRNTGIRLHRYGPPVLIGAVSTVACWLDMDDHTSNTLLGQLPAVALKEAA